MGKVKVGKKKYSFVQKQPRTKPINVIFCLPGPSFSNKFLVQWSKLLMACANNNINPMISQKYSSVVYYVRNQCLGGDVLKGVNQKPFGGEIDYDYMMWIDSDVIFTFEQFKQLLDHDLNIVSGYYSVEGGKVAPVVEDWNEEYFSKNGTFRFMGLEEIEERKGLFEVDYMGFGFTLVKKGVFESMEYPWFRPLWFDIGNARDFCSEDVAFCRIAKEKGFKMHVDPRIRVGHEKKVVM